MFAEDYRELKLPDAERIAARCFLFGDFFENFLADEPRALRFNAKPERLIIHAHCHAKSLTDPAVMRRLFERLPERTVTLLDTGCCGMAGAFGMMESKYELVAESRRAAHSRRPKPALRHDGGGVGRELPAANPASGTRPSAPPGGSASRGAGLNPNSRNCLRAMPGSAGVSPASRKPKELKLAGGTPALPGGSWCNIRAPSKSGLAKKIFQRAGKFGKLKFESGFQKSSGRHPATSERQ